MAWESVAEDFSAAATIVPFDPPAPLLRGPVAIGPVDDPSSRSFVLAFRDADSWRAAFKATESKILGQCEAGARAGCAISVSYKCKPPWWKVILGVKAMTFAEREQCEEREMSSCLASAKEACIKFAKEKCIPAFQEARIVAVPSKRSSQRSEEALITFKGSELMNTSFAETT